MHCLHQPKRVTDRSAYLRPRRGQPRNPAMTLSTQAGSADFPRRPSRGLEGLPREDEPLRGRSVRSTVRLGAIRVEDR